MFNLISVQNVYDLLHGTPQQDKTQHKCTERYLQLLWCDKKLSPQKGGCCLIPPAETLEVDIPFGEQEPRVDTPIQNLSKMLNSWRLVNEDNNTPLSNEVPPYPANVQEGLSCWKVRWWSSTEDMTIDLRISSLQRCPFSLPTMKCELEYLIWDCSHCNQESKQMSLHSIFRFLPPNLCVYIYFF